MYQLYTPHNKQIDRYYYYLHFKDEATEAQIKYVDRSGI